MSSEYLKFMARLRADNKDAGESVRVDGSHIYLYDVIDPYWGVSASDFVGAMGAAAGDAITLHINSPGGSVFEARAMVAAIRSGGREVKAVIDGLAASSASWIATSCASVSIESGAFIMIHNSWGAAMGNAREMRDAAAQLDRIDAMIVDEYARRVNASPEQIVDWMSLETWFSASDAIQYGFADKMLNGADMPGGVNSWDVSAYRNAPRKSMGGAARDARHNAPADDDDSDMRARLDRRVRMVLQGIH